MLTLRPSSLVAAVVLTGLSFSALPISSALQDGGSGGGLRPILPADPSVADRPLPTSTDTGLDAELWRSRLTDADLDRREASFDEAVERAVRSTAFADWLEGLAAGGDELAWTARLALRAASDRGGLRSRSPFGAGDPFEAFRRDPFGFDPFGGGTSPLDGWPFGGRGPFGAGPGGGGVGSMLDALRDAGRPGRQFRGQGLRLRTGPDGVEVEVRETVDGEESVETYRAEDLESLLEAHPELRDRIGGVTVPGRRGLAPRGAATTGEVRTDILGVRVAPTDPSRDGPEGLVVFDTELGTVAQLLGVGRGDVLLELNGRPLREVADVSEALAARPEGGELRLRWIDARGVETTRVWRPGPEGDAR